MSDDFEGFEAFFRHDYVPLIAFLRKVGFGREEAEDAAAEAMTCACQSWLELKRPRAWVRTAAYRIAIRQASRLREGTYRAISQWAVFNVDGAEQLRAVDDRLRVLAVLRLLPPRQRRVMAWHLDGFDTSEIADLMGMSEPTVRSTLRHARSRLKRALQPARTDERGPGTAGEVPDLGQ